MPKKITLLSFISLLILYSCSNRVERGEVLAKSYCASCHLFPDPSLLDKRTWIRSVLPQMGMRMGMPSDSLRPIKIMPYEEFVELNKAHVFPDRPMLQMSDWLAILTYYQEKAPEFPIPQDKKIPISHEPIPFEVESPKLSGLNNSLMTSMVKYLPQSQQLVVGDRKGMVFFIDKKLRATDSLMLESTPSDVWFSDKNYQFLSMGSMQPSDIRTGKLLSKKKELRGFKESTQLTQLARPVHLNKADLNQDGKDDYLICGYGFYTGKLSWFEVNESGVKEHILKDIPGARITYVQDFNHDGLPDILALMAQGDEQVIIFYNKGKGIFEEKQVLRFPPVYGSSYIELVDMNKDGFMDILYTNGDNGDYSYSQKKYHGVRLFLNNGKNEFAEKWFYPIHGATQVLADDFDGDRDIDMATIAFFPDFAKSPEESFLYFENTGNLHFQPKTIPEALDGSWLTMTKGDIDQDGDNDLVLGSFTYVPVPGLEKYKKRWIDGRKALLVLRNKRNKIIK